MDKPALEHVVICGAGLAGQITAAALCRQLPPTIRLTLVDCEDSSGSDLFYGSVTAPSSYDFNLAAGVSEPRLVMESDCAFSFGTLFADWGGRSWVQCFEQPLPIPDQVAFHHYLTQQQIDRLEPFLVSAQAARNGSFAHPPERQEHPLARAEYGYQFDPHSYAELFGRAVRLERIVAALSAVERDDSGIAGIRLSDGRTVKADLYVDCSGPGATLLSRLDVAFSGERRLRVAASRKAAERLGPPCRTVRTGDFGWQAETPLKGGLLRLTVFDPQSEASALAAHGEAPSRAGEARVGQHLQAWCGNCVAIGHAAAVLEPLTPAPMMLLQRDVERLLSLIPFSNEMSVECREYNRQYRDDSEHAGLFQRALFELPGLPDTPYWRAAKREAVPEKLRRKIEMFESRGVHVAYDLEPFNQEDWTILHYGMGRHPMSYDRVADKAPAGKVREYLSSMQRDIEKAVKAMPGHDVYRSKLAAFLTQQKS